MLSTKLLLLASLSGLVMLAGCQTTKTPSAATEAPFCKVAEPIYYSSRDTVETQKAVREHNAVWIALCQGGVTKP